MAIGEYTKALEIDSTYSAAFHSRAGTYGKLGQYQNAINDWTESLQFKDSNQDPVVYLNRGVLPNATSNASAISPDDAYLAS